MLTDFTEMTPTQIRALTRAQLLALILEGVEYVTRERYEYGPNGPVLHVRVWRDVDGNLLRRERIEWEYYPAGPVARVVTVVRDSSGNELRRRVTRYNASGVTNAGPAG